MNACKHKQRTSVAFMWLPGLEIMFTSLQTSLNFPPVSPNFPSVWHISLIFFPCQNHKISLQGASWFAYFFQAWWLHYTSFGEMKHNMEYGAWIKFLAKIEIDWNISDNLVVMWLMSPTWMSCNCYWYTWQWVIAKTINCNIRYLPASVLNRNFSLQHYLTDKSFW